MDFTNHTESRNKTLADTNCKYTAVSLSWLHSTPEAHSQHRGRHMSSKGAGNGHFATHAVVCLEAAGVAAENQRETAKELIGISNVVCRTQGGSKLWGGHTVRLPETLYQFFLSSLYVYVLHSTSFLSSLNGWTCYAEFSFCRALPSYLHSRGTALGFVSFEPLNPSWQILNL